MLPLTGLVAYVKFPIQIYYKGKVEEEEYCFHFYVWKSFETMEELEKFLSGKSRKITEGINISHKAFCPT